MHLKTSGSANRRSNRSKPITVHFPIPRKAISRLRSLAIEKDPRLVDLGVLAVQISDDESIVLGIELEKSKRKGLALTRDNPPSIPHTSGSFLGFDPLSKRNFESSKSGLYPSKHVTTFARNAAPLNKKSLSNAAIKKRAKDTLNAARRGGAKARGRAGRASLQLQSATIKASTWEMVYSHIGVPGDNRKKQTNPPQLEPNVASQASGVANVPVAQPMLPRENTKVESKKRETAALSPPHKSPGAVGGAIYSEDDSSVSSSPCSHSPMNEEELLNLFVDQNFSATSILKQLAESRNKEDGVNPETEEIEQKNKFSEQKQEIPDAATRAVSAQNGSEMDSLQNAAEALTPLSSKQCTIDGLSHFDTVSASNSDNPNTIVTPNASSLKRPTSLEDKNAPSVSWSNLFENPAKRQKRSFIDLETKKGVMDLATVHEQGMQRVRSLEDKSPETKKSLSSQPPHSSQSSVKTLNQSVALRNFSQYGYYYTAEDLKALGAKALGGKAVKGTSSEKANKTESVQKHEREVNTSTIAMSSTKSQLSTSASLQTQVKVPTIACSPIIGSPASHSGSTQQQNIKESCDFTGQAESVCQDQLKSERKCNTVPSEEACVPTSKNEDTRVIKSQLITRSDYSTSETNLSLSAPSMLTAENTETMTATNMNMRRTSGQCYALSYVYPMGTVWYPYVAITPYAVLGDNLKKEADSNSNEKDQAGTVEKINNHSQYIDLASSMRYWQQLSLLYKNKILASTPNITNMLINSDNSVSVNPVSSTTTTATSSMDTNTLPSLSTTSDKPPRRASVIVTTTEYNKDERASTSTPESTASTESIGSDGSKPEVVIDNCNRLIEEHCNRMNEVLSNTSQESKDTEESVGPNTPTVPSLSFIPDSSIAYVNIGNNSNQGSRKSGGSGINGKGKSKKRKSSKNM